MKRPLRSRNHLTIRTLLVEELEVRQLLTATAFQPDYIMEPLASSGISGYTPAQIRAAYGFNSVSFGSTAANGAGQTIAIIDAYDDPNITSDLAAFDKALGIAAPPSFKVVNQNGGSALPVTDPSQGWEGETALDVEWAHAIAPGANIVLVEANDASDTNLFAAVNYARNLPGVSVISMSWGSNDTLANQSYDQSMAAQYLVTPAGHQGITFVASSGDTGLPSFPAESPNVLAVGGTDLHLTSSGAISSETAWTPTSSGGVTYSGGGGVSQEFSGRKVPDVSYNAGIGMAVYDTFGPNHGWVGVGGTSAGAPQWAALIAIANQGRALAGMGTLNGASQTLAAIYAAPSSDFHDITTGSTQFESAGVGYDLATGRGSPVANALIPYLSTFGSSGGGVGIGTAPSAPTNFTGSALSSTQISLSWSATTGATSYNLYEFENGQPVLIGSYSAGTTSATVSGLAAGSTYAFNLVALNSAGSGATPWIAASTAAAASVQVSAPQNLQAAATSSNTVQLSWGAATGASGYRVYEWDGSQGVLVANLSSAANSTTIGGLTPGSAAYFYVSAYNSTTSAATAWVSAILPNVTAPLSAPTNLSANITSATTATLSWSGASGAQGYGIYYWNGSQPVLIGTVAGNSSSATISGLTPGTTSYFAVLAYNSASSVGSSWVSITAPLSGGFSVAEFAFSQSVTGNGRMGRV